MTTAEKIQDYQNRIKSLKQQRLTIGIPTDLRWDSHICPYCGKEREPIDCMGKTIYAVCGCDKAQEELRKSKTISDALKDISDRIEFYESQIEAEKEKAERLVKESLGRRFGSRTFETFKVNADNKKAYIACFDYAANFNKCEGKGLILSGSTGVGKTHLAAAITHKIIDDYGIPVQFKTAIEMHSELNEFNKDIYIKYKKCDLLVIDDLGKEKTTDWRLEKIFEILNSRYEDYLPVIITTNLAPVQLEESFGEATYSRLCEMCDYIPLGGEDWRTK